MKNFRLPFPERTYPYAERAQAPATVWQQLRKARHDDIAAFAAEMAATDLDLDPDLETAAIEHLMDAGKPAK